MHVYMPLLVPHKLQPNHMADWVHRDMYLVVTEQKSIVGRRVLQQMR